MSTVYCGVYSITHKESGKLYIGSSNRAKDRWWGHKDALRKMKHPNSYLQGAWSKYGEEAFEFRMIELVEDRTKLEEREQYWMDYYKSYERDKGYNICTIAYRRIGIIPWNKGKPWSPEMIQKISVSRRGKPMSEETKAKISTKLKNRIFSADEKAKLSAGARRMWARLKQR